MHLLVSLLLPYAVAAKKQWPGMRISVCLAQVALETSWGKKVIGNYNLWGIKSLSWVPGKVTIVTHEWNKTLKKMVEVGSEFSDFSTPEEAFGCYGRILTNSPYYKDARESKTLSEYIINLAKHWATDPDYSSKILAIIDAEHLREIDDVKDPIVKPSVKPSS